VAWVLAYGTVQLIEILAFEPIVSGQRSHLPAWRGVIGYVSLLISGVVFGSLTLPLWLLGGAFGGVLAIFLLSAGIISVVVASRSSRLVLALGITPVFLYLGATPFLMGMLGANVQIQTATGLGCIIFCAYCLGLWRSVERVRAAEARAREESELKRLEAEATNAAQSTFVANVSHELRTPISAMLAGAPEAKGAHDNASRNQAALIMDAGRMMKTLLDDILDHAKLEAGRMTVEAVPYDVRALTAQVARFWGSEARKKGLRLRVEGAASLPAWVEGDPTRLRQILNNLISNAVKFTDQGSVTLRLSAWAAEDENCALRFQIADTGQGMAPHQIGRLFTPFEQGDASVAATHGGTGLGLAISRQLAHLMGGHLTAFSVEGFGSVFTLALTLPLAEVVAGAPPLAEPEMPVMRPLRSEPVAAPAQAPEAPVQVPVEAEAPASAEPCAEEEEFEEDEGRPVRILVADDHEINRRAVQLVLAPTGAVITAVVNGALAVEAAMTEAFDVIIMDVRMPEMDGREATRRIRAMAGPNQFVPIIAVTADTEDDDKTACRDAGMTDFVGKPIDPARLLNTVIEAVNGAADESDDEAGRNVA
jgi:signal transduction histidine kinase/CheY-like chemotaxis protein